jgi:hypothetical protein
VHKAERQLPRVRAVRICQLAGLRQLAVRGGSAGRVAGRERGGGLRAGGAGELGAYLALVVGITW